MAEDRYYIEMYNLINTELKNEMLENILDDETIKYFANQSLFISDIYRIIDIIKNYVATTNNKKISIYEFKDILNKYVKNNN